MNPSIAKITAVADYLGVSLDELVGRKEKIQPTNFLEKLLNDTKDKKLLWKPIGYKKDFLYPLWLLKEEMESDRVCGYCEYGDACFVVEGYVDSNKKIENLCIFIIPNSDSIPVLQNFDEEDILPLFDEIRQDITWKCDVEGAEKVKEKFLDDKVR